MLGVGLGCGPTAPPKTAAGAPSSAASAPPTSASSLPASSNDVHRDLVHKVVTQYGTLGFGIDPSRLKVVVVDDSRVARDLATASGAISVPGQLEGLSIVMRMAGRSEGRDAASLEHLAVQSAGQGVVAYYDYTAETLAFRDLPLVRVMGLEPIVAHELGHAFQDQKLGGIQTFVEKHRQSSLDGLRAAHLVLEGHAQLLATATQLAQQGIPLSRLDPNLIDATAGRLLSGEALNALYAAGFAYAAMRWKGGGGWSAIEGALSQPPSSTEQVLHPEKDGRDLPREVGLPAIPEALKSGRVALETTVGEFMVYNLLLPEAKSLDDAFLAASGWDGDRLRVTHQPDETYTAEWRLVWDRADDAAQFARALETWTAASPQTKVVRRGTVVDVWYAESEPARAALAASLAAGMPRVLLEPGDVASTTSIEAQRIAAAKRRPRLQGGRWVMPEYGLSFAVPAGFRLVQVQGTDVLVGTAKGGFAENITVVATPDLYGGDIEKHVQEGKRQLAQTEQRLIEAQVVPIGGSPGALIEVEIAAGSTPIRARSALVLRRGRAITVTYSALAADWPSKREPIDQLVASLRAEE